MQRVAIHSVPRSGSTWLGAIFDSHPEVQYKYQPLFSYALKDFLDAEASEARIQDFFSKLNSLKDDFIDQVIPKQKGLIPTFTKNIPTTIVYKEVRYHHILSNLLEKDPEIIVLGLIRNPLAVVHSWLNAPKEFRRDLGWDPDAEWRFAPSKNQGRPEEYNGYEKWKEASLLFHDLAFRHPDRFILVRYQDLLENRQACVHKLFRSVNLELPEQTLRFLAESEEREVTDAYGVYKKKKRDDAWVDQLPPHIVNYIENDLKHSHLESYLSY